ncbi:MAG: NAD(P)H-hydrate dehydratase [Lachnospiraceae bacterium]|nr:NAD(P)H-hydrate dehydratase [Lachnospiraceae bacterium]
MKYAVTAGQMRAHEQYVMETLGIDAILLMERAALFTAEIVKERTQKDSRVLIVCGTGNNGADGLALARILTEADYNADVLLLGADDKRSALNVKQQNMLFCGQLFRTLTDTKKSGREYAVIVDAILGIGCTRMLEGEIKEAVEWMNTQNAERIAMDIPTGICSDTGRMLGTAFRADVTATFGLPKQGLYLGDGKKCAGKVKYDSCGMVYPDFRQKMEQQKADKTFVLEKADVVPYLKRDSGGNKSSFGKIGVLAGSRDIAGAAQLAVEAAFRSGGGYVRLCTHENNKNAVLQAVPETVLSLYDDVAENISGQVDALLAFADVICCGPGIGMSEDAKQMLQALLYHITENKTLILDADALNLIAREQKLAEAYKNLPCNVILTPHVLEFSRLSGYSVEEIKNDRVRMARKYATENKVILVLKDAQTVVADSLGNICISEKGNDGMAVAGSGDVLAGVLAGICGQVKDPYMSACLGVYIHATAGDRAKKKLGAHSMMPSDMIYELKKCMKKLGKEANNHEAV